MHYLIILLILLTCNLSFGGSGAFNNDGSDARGIGQAGAFTARADAPSTNWYNPAGLIKLDDSNIEFTTFYERTSNSLDSDFGRNIVAKTGNFIVPSLFYSNNLKNGWAYGIGINAPYGLATEWNDSITNYVATKSELKEMNINPNIAYSFSETISGSIGLDIAYAKGNLGKNINQTFLNSYLYTSMTGISTIVLSPDANSKLVGSDYSLGWNAAILSNLNEQIQLGLSYRSKIDLKLDGTTKINGLTGPAYLIFGGNSYETNASLKLSIPATLDFGLAYKFDKQLTIEFDIEWAQWSVTDEFNVKYKNESNLLRLSILNTGNPIEKNWKDTFNYILATEYKYTDFIIFGFGTRFRPAPIPEQTFDCSLPSTDLYDVCLGLTLNFSNSKIDFGFDYTFGDRNVTNSVGNTVGTSINGKYELDVLTFAIGYTTKI